MFLILVLLILTHSGMDGRISFSKFWEITRIAKELIYSR